MDFNIKDARKRLGLKQQEVADALGIPGRTYGAWERGERELKITDAVAIANLFGCSLDYLAGTITWEQEEERKRLDLLVRMFRKLNHGGQKKLMEYCIDLSGNVKYAKTDK